MATQREIIDKMTPAEKLQVASDLFYSAWELKLAAVKQFHPELSDEEQRKIVRDFFLYAR